MLDKRLKKKTAAVNTNLTAFASGIYASLKANCLSKGDARSERDQNAKHTHTPHSCKKTQLSSPYLPGIIEGPTELDFQDALANG